jgi:hypothetical protein
MSRYRSFQILLSSFLFLRLLPFSHSTTRSKVVGQGGVKGESSNWYHIRSVRFGVNGKIFLFSLPQALRGQSWSSALIDSWSQTTLTLRRQPHSLNNSFVLMPFTHRVGKFTWDHYYLHHNLSWFLHQQGLRVVHIHWK